MSARPRSTLFAVLVLIVLVVGTAGAQTDVESSGIEPIGDSLSGPAPADTIIPPTFIAVHVFAGASLPIGSFGASEGSHSGFALPGPMMGVDFSIYADSVNLSVNWASSLTISRNESDVTAVRNAIRSQYELPPEARVEAGPWYLMTALTGFEFKFPIASAVRLGVLGQLGFGVGRSSEVVLGNNSAALVQKANTAAAYAFSSGLSLSLYDVINLGVRYSKVSITYDLTTIQLDGTSRGIFYEQPMNGLYILAGISL